MTSFAAHIAPVTAPLTTAPAVSASAALGHQGGETDSELFSALVAEVTGQTVQPDLAAQSAPSIKVEGVQESAALLSPQLAAQVQETSALAATPHAATDRDATPSSEGKTQETELKDEITAQTYQEAPPPAQVLTTSSPAPSTVTATAKSESDEAEVPGVSPGQDKAVDPASKQQEAVEIAPTAGSAGTDQKLSPRPDPAALVPAPTTGPQARSARTAESAAVLQGLLAETPPSEGAPLEGTVASAPQPPVSAAQTATTGQALASGLPSLPLPLRNGPSAQGEASPQGLVSDAEDQTVATQAPSPDVNATTSDAGQKGLVRTETTSLASSLQAQLTSGNSQTAASTDQPTLDPAIETQAPSETQQAQANEPASPPASALSRTTVETTALIAAQILKKLDSRSTRFDMALTPESLGRVDVSMEIDADGQVTARLAFDNPAAAAELRGRVDELRRQLQDAGLQVHEDSFEFTDRNPSSGFGGGAFDRQPQHRAFAGAARLRDQADGLNTNIPPQWTTLNLTPDRVDLKV